MPLPSGDLRRLSMRTLGWIGLGLLVLFLAETGFELLRSGTSWSDLHSTSASARALTTTVSRAFNNLLAVVLGFVSIAIPITANMYTPRLVEIFFSDRINLAGLVFFAAAGAHALFCQWLAFDQWVPHTHIHVLWLSGILAFAVAVPYYLYVLEFLNPTTIIRHVQQRVVEAFPSHGCGTAERALLHDRVMQLGNVVLRAVDRADRDVAIASIHALQQSVLDYVTWKPSATAAWFVVDRELFPALATEAITILRHERTWVEHACLHQLRVAYVAALARMPDAVGTISAVTRHVAVGALRAGDDALLGLSIRFFNTFVRQAIGRRDGQAVYDVFRQYRALAIELLSARPVQARAIVRHMRYYGDFAASQGLPFVHDIAATDVAVVVEAAFDAKSPVAADVLEEYRRFRGEKATLRFVKSLAATAAWLRAAGHADAASATAADLLAARPEDLAAARRDFLATDDPVFWEVTDRQTNLDYLPPDRRAGVVALLDETIARLQEPGE